MTDHKALTRIAKAVATDMVAERLSAATRHSMRGLGEDPRHLFDLADLMAKEGKRKRPSDKLIGGYTFLLAHGLEMLRYGADREDSAAIALATTLRQHLFEAGGTGLMTPPILLLVLHQFATAKLEIGGDLRNLVQTLMENDHEAREVCERGEGADHFERMVEQFGSDPFAIHAYLDEAVEAMPEDGRAGLVMATFGDKTPAMHEAAVSFRSMHRPRCGKSLPSCSIWRRLTAS